MKIVIIGYGAVGSVLTKILAKEKSVNSIFCLDIKFFEKINLNFVGNDNRSSQRNNNCFNVFRHID